MRSFLLMIVLSWFSLMPVNAQEEDFAALMFAQSKHDFEETYSRLKDRLAEEKEIQIFAEIDHAEDARKTGRELLPSRLIIFGNAKAGTPIMQNRQVAGLDLPLKILLFENEKGDILVAYSNVALLKNRYALKTKNILRGIRKNLKDITYDVTGRNPKKTGAYKVRYQEGILSIKSKHSFKESLSRLKNEINNIDELILFAEIDHTKNAEEKGLGMRPASLLVFGNAEVGTGLI
ncbi:MAG TPA: DUF302 domain-containing protein, partial [Salegentibacter sp.]|nr:DUF302 domain-containing protein [Salegentibacter sp.]